MVVSVKRNIITHNTYLEIALNHIIKIINHGNGFIIIDLDSSSSLEEIHSHVKLCESLHLELFLTGYKGIYSELFSCFSIINPNESLNKIIDSFTTMETNNPIDVNNYIESTRKLELLTRGQIKICLLDRKNKIKEAPKCMSLNISSIYRNIWIAANKMNFKSLIKFRKFIENEFTNEDLNSIIVTRS